jgi:hypothetical protein
VGFRDHRPPTSLDSGLRRNDGEGDESGGKMWNGSVTLEQAKSGNPR